MGRDGKVEGEGRGGHLLSNLGGGHKVDGHGLTRALPHALLQVTRRSGRVFVRESDPLFAGRVHVGEEAQLARLGGGVHQRQVAMGLQSTSRLASYTSHRFDGKSFERIQISFLNKKEAK